MSRTQSLLAGRPVAGDVRAVSRDRRTVQTSSGRTLSYIEAGTGPDVLLLHGTLTTLDDWRLSLFEDLAREFHVVAIDRPSHGASDRDAASDASLWSQAGIIHDAAQGLGLDQPVVCGHSYGAAVALAYGMGFGTDCAGVVALAPICFPEPRLEHLLFGPRATLSPGLGPAGMVGAAVDRLLLPVLWRAMFLPQVMPARFAEEFPFGLAGQPSRTRAEGESANALWFDLTRSASRYAGCRLPVRFVAGAADIVVNPVFHSCAAAAIMPGARLDLLPGMGHMLHHFRKDIVIQRIRDVTRAAGRNGAGLPAV